MAGVLAGGDVVALVGELGAGKTRLVRAIVSGLCSPNQRVSSPTFVLMQRYDGPIPVFHFDAYRMADVDEFVELGVEEIFADGGVCMIEWADRVASALPADRLQIDIRVAGPASREFVLSGTGRRSNTIVQTIADQAAELP